MTLTEKLREKISRAFYNHGLLCASYPIPIILFTGLCVLACCVEGYPEGHSMSELEMELIFSTNQLQEQGRSFGQQFHPSLNNEYRVLIFTVLLAQYSAVTALDWHFVVRLQTQHNVFGRLCSKTAMRSVSQAIVE
ncbi:hypothetical protein KIL84_010403 [Mauremys mutica]|uniref:Uncharacterized protein n=1 Tax=Mauremys mutica TaxID=74926 RepID=A0A9D4B1D1_9SAUR|nr:hypothetical protein KIL84_010403 [Mauremys mutica]